MKKIIIIGVIMLLVLNFIALNKYRTVKKQLETINLLHKKELNKIDETLSNRLKTHQNNSIISMENENLKLDQNLKLRTIEGDTVFAKKIFENKNNSLVLRYSVLNCGDCIDAELTNLEQYSKQFSKQIVIITYHKRIRGLIMDYKKLQEMGLDNIKLYMLLDNKLGIPVEKYNVPYYFHINPELTISNVFIPIKENPRLSENYLKYNFKNFFSKEITE